MIISIYSTILNASHVGRLMVWVALIVACLNAILAKMVIFLRVLKVLSIKVFVYPVGNSLITANLVTNPNAGIV